MEMEFQQRTDLCLAKAIISRLSRTGGDIDSQSILHERAAMLDGFPSDPRPEVVDMLDIGFMRETCGTYGYQSEPFLFEGLEEVQRRIIKGEMLLVVTVNMETGVPDAIDVKSVHTRGTPLILTGDNSVLYGEEIERGMRKVGETKGFNGFVITEIL